MALKLATADITLTATNQAILTAAGPGTISKVIICNTTASNRTVTIHKVPGGGSATTGNIVVDAFPIGAGLTAPLPLSGLVLQQADSLQGLASVTASVNISAALVMP